MHGLRYIYFDGPGVYLYGIGDDLYKTLTRIAMIFYLGFVLHPNLAQPIKKRKWKQSNMSQC